GTDQRRLLVELELDETLFTPSSAPRARWSQGAVGTMGAGVPLQHQSAATGSVASSSSQRGRPHHTMGVQPTVSSSPYRLKQRVLSSRKSTTAEPLHRSASTRCFSAKHNSHQQQQQQRLRSLQLVVDTIHHNIQQREQLVDQVQQELAARRVAVAQDRSAPALSAPLVKLLNKLRSVSLSIVEMVVFFNQEKARFSHAAIDVQEDHFVLATEFEDYLLKLTHCDVDFMALYAPLAALFDRAGVSLMRNPFLDGVSLDSSELLLCSCHRASDNTGGATSSLTQLLVHRLEAFGLNMRKLMPAWQVLPAQRVATALLQLFETESRRNAARMLPSFLQPHDVSFYATNLSAGLHDRQQPPLGADGAQPPLSCQSWTATETIREDPDDDIKFIKMPTLDTQSIQAPKAAEVAVATVTVPPLDISMVVSPAVEVEAPQPKSKPSSVHTNTSESKGSGREKQNKPKSQPTSSRAQDEPVPVSPQHQGAKEAGDIPLNCDEATSRVHPSPVNHHEQVLPVALGTVDEHTVSLLLARIAQLEATVMEPKTASALDQTREDEHDEVADTYDHAVPALNWTKSGGEDVLDADADTHEEEDEVFHYSSVRALASIASALDILPTVTLEGGISTRRSDDREEISMATPTELPAASSVGLVNTIEGPNQATPRMTEESTVASVSAEIPAVASAPVSTEQLSVVALSPPTQQESETDEDRDSLARIMALCRDVQVAAFDLSQFLGKTFTSGPEDAVVEPVMAPPVAAPPPSQSETNTNSREVGPIPVGKQFLQRELKLLRRYVRPWRAYVVTLAAAKTLVRQRSAARSISRCYLAYREHQRALELQRQLEQRQAAATRLQHQWSHYQARVRQCADQNEFHCQQRTFKRWVLFVRVRHRRARREMAQQQISACWRQHQANQAAAREAADKLAREREQRRYAAQRVRSFLQERHLRHKLAVAREMTKQILFKQQLHATKIRREQEKNKMLEAKRLRELEARYRRALSAMEQQFQSADEERRVLALRQQHLLELKHKQDTKRRREMAAQRIQAFMRVTTLQHKLHVVEQAKHRLATQQQKAVALRQREDIQRERKQAQLRLERRVLARRLAKAERATVELRVQHEQLAQTAQVRDASAQRALAFERIQAFVYQIAQARRSQQVQVTLLQRQAELEQQQAAQEAAARRVLAQERIHAFVHKHLAERRLAVAQEAAKKLLIKQNLLVRRQRQQATKAAALMDKRQREKSRSLIGVWITEQVKAARARKEAERQRQALEEHVAGETARRRVLEAENAALRVREAQAEQRLMVQTNLRALQRRKSQMKEQQHAEKRRREAAGQRIQAFVVHHTERHGAAVAQRKLEQRKIEEQQAAIAMERRVLDCFVRAIVDSKLVAETVALNGVVAALGRVREIIHTAERRKQQLLQQQQADAATQIQTQWRGHSARELVHEQKRQLLLERQRQHQRERVASLTRRSSARKIQRQWRREQRRQQRRQQETEAATAIETRWRGHKARQQHEVRKQQRQQQQRTHAATDIQRQWKGHAAREQYTRVQQQHQHQRQRQHHAATHIQAQWRGAQGRQRVEQLREERRAFRAKQAALAERVAARKMSDHTCERWARRQIQQQQQCDPVDEDGKEESQMVAEASVSVEQRQQWASVVIQRMVRAHQRRRALQFRVEQSDGHCCEVWFARGRAWLSWSVAPLLRARYDVQLTRRLLAMLEVSALGLNNELQQALAVLAQDTQPLLLTGMSQSLDVEVDVAEMELPAFCQLTRQIGRIKSMHKRAEVAKSSSSTPSSPVSSRPASPKNKLAPPAEPAPGATGGLSIWEAIESASVEDLQFLRARGVDLAQRDPATQRTALHALTFCREPFRFKLEMLSFLLGPLAQLDVDARDQHGDTPLALYAAHGHLGLVDKLLAHGADLASVNAKGQTALHRACEADQVEVVAFLQARCRAAGDHALAQRLHALDRDGRSPLHVAAEKGFVECARQLLDVQDELTQMLLWQWDPQGRTALHVAVQHSQLDVATLLLACAGGSALANGYDHLRRYPLHLAVEAHQATQLIQLLVANGADVNATDERGDTALHWAAFAGREAVVQTLLALEADVTMLNSDWETAAQIAAAYDHMSCITLLVQAQRHGVAATPVETGPDDGAERRRVKKDQSKTKGEYWAELHQEVQLVEESGRFSSEDEGGVGDGSDSD
ncbi:TPA: hypothetical protein N0F65_008989, partial [Lagenidium giganteum]